MYLLKLQFFSIILQIYYLHLDDQFPQYFFYIINKRVRETITSEYEERWNFPNYISSMDCKFIEIKQSQDKGWALKALFMKEDSELFYQLLWMSITNLLVQVIVATAV